MQEQIREIFVKNIELIGLIDKAVIYFREGRYDMALKAIADTGDGINATAEAIISNREYFKLVSTDSVAEMLQGILEAKQKRDYVLLADLYEMQLSNFICSVQELILKKEDFLAFEEDIYKERISRLEEKLGSSLVNVVGFAEDSDEKERRRVNQNAILEEPINPERMLKEGYSVEFTSCGLMTMGAPMQNGDCIYLHTNGRVSTEGFIQAKSWYDSGADEYIVYGFGMGYHIDELHKLVPDKHITVYENDINILKLYCAFAADGRLLAEDGIDIVYDPDFRFIEKKLNEKVSGQRVCVHYPSYRRQTGCKALDSLIGWSGIVEEC